MTTALLLLGIIMEVTKRWIKLETTLAWLPIYA